MPPCIPDPTLERPIPDRGEALRVYAGEGVGGFSSCFPEWRAPCPDPSSAAIILTFALNEAIPLATPKHLPETRAIAIATQRSGPTMEDFRALVGVETPLFANMKQQATPSNKSGRGMGSDSPMILNPDFSQVIKIRDVVLPTEAYFYIPGRLTGLWEGSYMVGFAASSYQPVLIATSGIGRE